MNAGRACSPRDAVGNTWAISYTLLTIGLGGGGRIRTSEGIADRFTVCSLWPLGNPSTLIAQYRLRIVVRKTNALMGYVTPKSEINHGASGGTRTPGRLITNQQLYQLSYAGRCKVRKNKIVKRRRRSSMTKPRPYVSLNQKPFYLISCNHNSKSFIRGIVQRLPQKIQFSAFFLLFSLKFFSFLRYSSFQTFARHKIASQFHVLCRKPSTLLNNGNPLTGFAQITRREDVASFLRLAQAIMGFFFMPLDYFQAEDAGFGKSL